MNTSPTTSPRQTATASHPTEETEEVRRTSAEVTKLKGEVELLTRSLAEVSAEEAELIEQSRSLKYALELTRGEVERRTRANTELQGAYQQEDDDDDNKIDTNEDDFEKQHAHVQRLEVELFNAKRDAANIVYEVETLEIQLKRLQEMERQAQTQGGGQPNPKNTDHKLSPTNTTVAKSPTIASKRNSIAEASKGNDEKNNKILFPILLSKSTPTSPLSSPLPLPPSSPSPLPSPSPSASPNTLDKTKNPSASAAPSSSPTLGSSTMRSARLIGDVDALIGFSSGVYEACRLGVSANGQIAVYSYASPSPLLIIDDILERHVEPLSTADAFALADALHCVKVHAQSNDRPAQANPNNSSNTATLCGLTEAIRAAMQLMEDSRHSIQTRDGYT